MLDGFQSFIWRRVLLLLYRFTMKIIRLSFCSIGPSLPSQCATQILQWASYIKKSLQLSNWRRKWTEDADTIRLPKQEHFNDCRAFVRPNTLYISYGKWASFIKNSLQFSNWPQKSTVDADAVRSPQQENYDDCGAFVCANGRYISHARAPNY